MHKLLLHTLSLYFFCLITTPLFAEDSLPVVETKKFVTVYVPTNDEKQKIELRKNQLAMVYVFLGGLGEPLDKFMVSIISNDDNSLVASKLSGPSGEITFERIPAGNYTVYVNRRVIDIDEISTVKVSDVRLRAYP